MTKAETYIDHINSKVVVKAATFNGNIVFGTGERFSTASMHADIKASKLGSSVRKIISMCHND